MKLKKLDAEKLGKCLAKYGSLDKTIESMKAEIASLQPNVEELRKTQAGLKTEVQALSEKKTTLSNELKGLENLKQTLSQTVEVMQSQRKHLEKYLPKLENDVKVLETRRDSLEKENSELEKKTKEMEEKLKATSEVDRQLEEKTKALQEIEAKVSAAGLKFRLFEGLLGFMGANQAPGTESFLRTLPSLIEEARTGKHDADFLKKYVLGKLTWHSLDVMVCNECQVEFVVVRRFKQRRLEPYAVYRTEPEYCPICGASYTVLRKKELADMLEKELRSEAKVIEFVPVRGKISEKATPQKNETEEKLDKEDQK